MIAIIELSPPRPATAYVAATRYKLDDYRPYLYKTDDYGQTWRAIAQRHSRPRLHPRHPRRPGRPGLLYAGTETGIYVSFDDGATWQRLPVNLPVAPIHDCWSRATT